MPTPPSHVNQQKLLDALRLWIREGEQCVVDYRTKLETWRRCHTKVCQEDVEELRNHIRFLEKQIEERQISSMKEMDPVLVEANGWIVEQEERLADARQTMDALVAVGKNTTSSFESTTTPVLVPPTNADGGAGPSQSDPPSELLCPITLDLMKDPVIAADGHTYERSAIEQVFNQSTNRSNNPVSPCTNLSLPSRALIPNVGIRSMCRRWDNSNNDNTAVVVMEELPPTG
uniref:U-box domain-containing protein n=1 Tax=Grammatophora oceanica TaxID=210454 RepID=A0A7S1VV23_9STRA|mmetsp:Transcript_9010/g.13164  ORF Transcript_9010/g.13164 Transcript_9010/m.13164 type:complete len:231 (+) Transcript_9010:78-770(+)